MLWTSLFVALFVGLPGALLAGESAPSIPSPSPQGSKQIVVDEAQRSRVIDGARWLLREFYVFPDVAEQVSAKLSARNKRGAYRNISDAEILAAQLSHDLVELSGDKHVGIDFFAEVVPDGPPASRPHPDPRMLARRNSTSADRQHATLGIGRNIQRAIRAGGDCSEGAHGPGHVADRPKEFGCDAAWWADG